MNTKIYDGDEIILEVAINYPGFGLVTEIIQVDEITYDVIVSGRKVSLQKDSWGNYTELNSDL